MSGERFLVLNGDVLTDLDLGAQIARHDEAGARGTLALVPVEDPAAYGLVRLGAGGAVAGFLEKPKIEEIDTNLISAGAYVLERDVLDLIPPDRNVSIEREIWPELVGHGLYGFAAEHAYWMDIGTPDRYLRGSFDILEGRVKTALAEKLGEALGDAVVVENSGAAGGNVGAARVARAAPDGHTLLMTHQGIAAINPRLFASPGYDALRDFAAHGLVREIALYGAKTWYDTKIGPHYHFYLEDRDELFDIPEEFIPLMNVPAPEGTEIVATFCMPAALSISPAWNAASLSCLSSFSRKRISKRSCGMPWRSTSVFSSVTRLSRYGRHSMNAAMNIVLSRLHI